MSDDIKVGQITHAPDYKSQMPGDYRYMPDAINGTRRMDVAHLKLDCDPELARAVHRVIRAMHDGECPKCHGLFRPEDMVFQPGKGNPFSGHRCPNTRCLFTITKEEEEAGIKLFAKVMEKNLAVFEAWRRGELNPQLESTIGYVDCGADGLVPMHVSINKR